MSPKYISTFCPGCWFGLLPKILCETLDKEVCLYHSKDSVNIQNNAEAATAQSRKMFRAVTFYRGYSTFITVLQVQTCPWDLFQGPAWESACSTWMLAAEALGKELCSTAPKPQALPARPVLQAGCQQTFLDFPYDPRGALGAEPLVVWVFRFK